MTLSRVAQPTIAGAYAQLLREWLLRERVADADLLAELERLRPQERVPLLRWQQWLQRTAAARESPAFALGIGAVTADRHLGLLAHLARCTPTLESALQDYLRFEGLQYGMSWARLEHLPDGSGLRWLIPRGVLDPLVEIVGLSSFYTYARDTLAAGHLFARVSFSFPEPADAAVYRRYFACPVEFGRSYAQLLFLRDALQRAVGRRDEALRARLHAASTLALDLSDPASQLVRDLLDFIQDSLPEGGAVLDRFAAQQGVTPRAVQKRLAAGGQDFRSLLTSVRQHSALYFLADSSLTLAEVSFLLGYSEQSAFNHAFAGWFGTTPNAHRLSMRLESAELAAGMAIAIRAKK